MSDNEDASDSENNEDWNKAFDAMSIRHARSLMKQIKNMITVFQLKSFIMTTSKQTSHHRQVRNPLLEWR